MQAVLYDGLYASLAPTAARFEAPLVAGTRTTFPLLRPNGGEPSFLKRES